MSYGKSLALWSAFAGEQADTPTSEQAEEWVASMTEKGNKPATVNVRLAALRKFGKWAGSPIDVSALHVTQREPDPYTQEEYRAIFDHLGKIGGSRSTRLGFLILFLYATGMRASEALNVRLPDINMKERVIVVVGKGSKRRNVSWARIEDEMLLWLAIERPKLNPQHDYLLCGPSGRRITYDSLRMTLYRLGTKAGVEYQPHRFRRTFATDLHRAGASPEAISKALGHSNVAVTSRYIGVTNDELHDLGDKLSYLRSA